MIRKRGSAEAQKCRSKNCIPAFVLLLFCSIALSFITSCAPIHYEAYPEISYPKASPPETKPPHTKPPDAAVPKSKYIVASWYGSDFHGKPTSSGELYNMYTKTCAHKEYSFGTRLKVTNISNDKSVECTVNDRGPFIAGRDLDLSYACAKEIGLIGAGTAKVRIEHLGRDTRYVKEVRYSPARAGSEGPFTIQVGSYKDMSNAMRMKTALEFKYSKVYITKAEVNDSAYFRVNIGKFSTKDDAYRLAKTLADEGYSTLIKHYDERI